MGWRLDSFGGYPRQRECTRSLRHGVQHLKSMKMQGIADAVHMHICSKAPKQPKHLGYAAPVGCADARRLPDSLMRDARWRR